ncbi:unnamed protein product [Cuscuta campestris]|uniref:Uncharacterized protein n=1 Tax=Cuscuta campestris TaxID=132261 RepID=A0A484N5N8_9ASTE|nr:unnamed protein product [Cuscuta campestris]
MFRSVGLAAESPHLGAATVCCGCRRETDAAGKTLAHCSAILSSPLSPRRYRYTGETSISGRDQGLDEEQPGEHICQSF